MFSAFPFQYVLAIVSLSILIRMIITKEAPSVGAALYIKMLSDESVANLKNTVQIQPCG